MEDEWIGTIKNADGEIVKTLKWVNAEPAEFSWRGTNDDETQVMDGVYSYEITATDKAGNKAPQSTITNIIYSAEKPATNIFVEGSRYFSPRTESKISTVTFNLTIPVPEVKTGNRLVEWSVNIEDKNGKTCAEIVDYTLFKIVMDNNGNGHGEEVGEGRLNIEWKNEI